MIDKETIIETWVSYGGGVQTFGMLLLMRKGIIAKCDGYIFSNTMAEYPETYFHIEKIVKPLLYEMKIPFIEVYEEPGIIEGYKNNNTIPLPGFRSCTMKYKVEPIRKYFRNKLDEMGIKRTKGKPLIKLLIGISTDEKNRAIPRKQQRPKWIINEYPFLEIDMSRRQIEQFIEEEGFEIPKKSGCYICPYSGLKGFVNLKANYPELFKIAIEMEELYFKNRKEKKYGFIASSMIRLSDLNEIPSLYSFVDKLPEEPGSCKNNEGGGCFL